MSFRCACRPKALPLHPGQPHISLGSASKSSRPSMKGILMPEVISFGAHIADALGWPFTEVPPGQQLAMLDKIKFTVAGTAAAPSVNLAKLGVDVATVGRIGNDSIG